MRIMITVLSLLMTFSTVAADTLHVPAEYPTIQGGITAAVAGDTVLIACGAYYEHDILMKSGICLRGETGNPDCVSIYALSLGRVIVCTNVDDQASIEGLTLSQGRTEDGDGNEPWPGYGAGIFCIASSPNIRDCRVRDCFAETGGAGICLFENSNPLIENCRVEDNEAIDYGGGLMADWSSPDILQTEFIRNSSGFLGGAVSSSYSNLDVEDCTFFDNEGRYGGALRVKDSQVSLRNCTLAWNSAEQGSAVYMRHAPFTELSRCLIAFGREGLAFYCDFDCESPVFSCCDQFGNAGGDWTGSMADQLGVNGNIAADPFLCGEFGSEDFTVRQDSPCAAETNPDCGRIGAWGVGCGSVGVLPTNWSRIKFLY